ncbi:MAG: glycerate kinase [Thermodesulfobacteriota bacterium]|nr:MAG: glycerate kinase [Thermodesulfobacteriota bacterium]
MKEEKILEIFHAALRAADPVLAIKKHISLAGQRLMAGDRAMSLGRFKKVLVVGAGKASASMAVGIAEVLGPRIESGLVVVKYGCSKPLERIEVVEAAHPLPDEPGVRATERIIELLGGADGETLVICLLSGGGSALLCAPAGITLEDMRQTTDLLLKAGADIFDLNTVRKHLSKVKGGRLAEAADGAALITLILSDVIGDCLDVIASGPTVPDTTTFGDAMDVIKKYSLEEKLPAGVLRRLRDGSAGLVPETPKGGEDFFKNTMNLIIASLDISLQAAREKANKTGIFKDARIVSNEVRGEARNAAVFLARKAVEAKAGLSPGDKPLCLISGGETVVTVKGEGKGGRNQELALAFAIAITGVEGVTLLSSATDGNDGDTDASGAIVDGLTATEAEKAGLDAVDFLNKNDSYTFFKSLDELTGIDRHIKTGPTGTNVMDIQIIMVEP